MQTRTRTTISLPADVYDEAQRHLKDMGFSRLSDMISAAVRQYIQQRRQEEMDRSMGRAASDTRYRKVLSEIGRDLEAMDEDGLSAEY